MGLVMSCWLRTAREWRKGSGRFLPEPCRRESSSSPWWKPWGNMYNAQESHEKNPSTRSSHRLTRRWIAMKARLLRLERNFGNSRRDTGVSPCEIGKRQKFWNMNLGQKGDWNSSDDISHNLSHIAGCSIDMVLSQYSKLAISMWKPMMNYWFLW